MTCKKCGQELAEGFDYCPSCGRCKNEKKNGFRGLRKFIGFLIILFFITAGFFGGAILGIWSERKQADEIPPVITESGVLELLNNAVNKLTAVPFKASIEENRINELIQQNMDYFSPLYNINADLSQNGVGVISGQIKIEDVTKIINRTIPRLVYIFLPEVLNIRMEITVENILGEITPRIKDLTILNLENSKELLSELNLDEGLELLFKAQLTAALPPEVNLKTVEIKDKKLVISGTSELM
jgi:hypothetical protein